MNTILRLLLIAILYTTMIGCEREYTDKLEEVEYDYGELVYPGTTHVFDSDDVSNTLQSYSNTSGEIVMNSNDRTAFIEEGHILMLAPSEETPFGVLRKVNSVSANGNSLTFTTSQATLNDAVVEGSFTTNLKLTPGDVYMSEEKSGVILKSAQNTNEEVLRFELDQVNLSGDEDIPVILDGEFEVEIDPEITFKFKWRQPPDVKTEMVVEIFERLNFSASFEYNEDPPPPVTIYEAYFHPIVVWGIVLVPKLEILAGLDGSLSASISTGAQQRMQKIYNLDFVDGNLSYGESQWSILEKDAYMAINAKATLETYLGPKLNILIFGLVGPYVYLTGNMVCDVDINDPVSWWTIDTHVGAEFGLNGDIFGIDDPPKLEWESEPWNIAKANGGFPFLDLCTISGKVVEAHSRNPVGNVSIKIGQYESGSFNVITQSSTDLSGDYEIKVPPGNCYNIIYEKQGYITQNYEIQQEVTVGGSIIHQMELLIDESYSGIGSISGTILDAFTGYELEEVQVELYSGHYNTSGSSVALTSTNAYGQYYFSDIEAGYYSVVLKKAGYTDAQFNTVILGGQHNTDKNGAISPTISESEWRIILTWGSTPSDLDSHITGPVSSTSDRFHVYYNSLTYTNGSFYCNLDVDDTNYFGPETITLKNIGTGTFRYSIHDYSNSNSTYSATLSRSEAKVVVYNGNRIVNTFNVPNQYGTLWTVFEIRNNTLYQINSMDYESNSDNVKSGELKSDVHLMNNLPQK